MAVAKPKIIAAVAGVAVLAAGGIAWTVLGAGQHEAPAASARGGQGGGGMGGGSMGRGGGRATDVVAVPVGIHAFSGKIEALGTLEPRERVDLTANAADRVTAVFFEDGRRVAKGATLMTLAADEEHALLDAAQASQADARRIYDRNQRLADDGAISSKELETSKANAEATAASVRSLQARIRDRVLVAPFSGILGFRKVSTGAYVSPGEVVATLIDDSEMRLEFGVPSTFVTSLKPGLAIDARSADLPDRIFTGKLTSVDNAIDPVTRSVKVRATLPNTNRQLRAGMFMSVNLMPSSRNALAAPEIAVVSEGPDSYVFVVSATPDASAGGQMGGGQMAGKPPAGGAKTDAAARPGPKPSFAKKVLVTVGAREKGIVEITSGLKSGDLIITDGILKMRPNAPILVKSPDGAPIDSVPPGEARIAAGDGPSAKADLRQ